MTCMRVCPTEAIRVVGGTASLLSDRCIDCGECMAVCKTRAITPLTDSFTDFSHFHFTVALPSPALYSQFGRGVTPETVLAALREVGFDDVADLTAVCAESTAALRAFLDRHRGHRPIISPFCPTVLRLIQVKYPDLVELVAPIESPKELVAQEVKARKAKELGVPESEIGAIYLTPCPGKMLDVRHPTRRERSAVDGAIAISHLYGSLLTPLSRLAADPPPLSQDVAPSGLAWVVLGGQAGHLGLDRVMAVGGLDNVMRILDDIEDGRLRDVDYIECRSCRDGCVGGSLTVENPYEARSKMAWLLKRYEEAGIGAGIPESVADLSRYLVHGRLSASPLRPLDQDVSAAIRKMKQKEEVYAGLPGINCGACGAPSCMAFAEDVVVGRAEPTRCLFTFTERLRQVVGELAELLAKAPAAGGRSDWRVP